MRSSAVIPLLALLPLALSSGGCDLDAGKKIEALEKRVASLEKKNEQLERRLAHLGAERGPAAAPKTPLDAFGKLLGQLGKGNFKIKTRPGTPRGPGRQTPMDPELQKRIDKMVVEGLEKLSNNKDAKELVKQVLKAIKRDLERQAKQAR